MFGVRRRFGGLAALALVAILAAACGGSSQPSGPAGTVSITIGALSPPSLGSFLPPIIKDQKFDTQNGLDLQFNYSANDAYNLSYTSGQLQVGGSASLVQEALRWQNGVQSVYLFNVVDFWTGFLTKDASLKSITDLAGKTVGMTTGSSNYALTIWYMQQVGLDITKVKVVNLTSSALGPALEAGQVQAIGIPEPGFDTALGINPNLKVIPLDIVGIWKQKFGTTFIPFLGVAGLPDWVSSHQKEIQGLYKAYKMAADFAAAHPDQAGQIIAKTIPGGQAAVITKLISDKEKMPLNVVPAQKIKPGLDGVVQAGLSTGYIKQKPGNSFLYTGLS
jgi:ABC-type nitrate/sulfonate/bicarbonate transport system substrate-binding protein